MKRNLLILFALICSVSLFTACNNDDGPEQIRDGEFDGVYLGQLDVDAKGLIKVDDIPQKVYITKTGENQIKMELKNFSFQTLNLGTIAVENIVVVKDGTGCTFTGGQKITLLVGECDVTVKGSIEDSKLNMDIDVLAGGTLNVNVDFEGIKMEADKSSEADILTFTFNSPLVIEQPKIAGTTITFAVAENITDEELKALIPSFTVSEKATIDKTSGQPADFTAPVVYTVVSEDGITTKKYTVSCTKGKALLDSFEDWETKTTEDSEWTYQLPKTGGWIGADAALALVQMMLENADIEFNEKSLMPTTDAHSGDKAAKIITLNTYGQESIMPGFFPAIPHITSGSLFLGSFEIDATNTLRSTRFGIEYDKEPLVVKGYYKYTPGKDYYRCDDVNKSNVAVLDNTKQDECAISAVLYEVSSYAFPEDPYDKSDERLNGTNIYDSPRIVAAGKITSGAKEQYTQFELELNYLKPYDSTKLYRFAIICSSSKDGDKFCGAPGSTLIVDDIQVAYK